MTIHGDFDTCVFLWKQFLESFHGDILRGDEFKGSTKLLKDNVKFPEAEVWLFNKFLYYLWGSSINKTNAFGLDGQIDIDEIYEKAYNPYANLLFENLTDKPDYNNAIHLLISIRNVEYRQCILEPVKTNLKIN